MSHPKLTWFNPIELLALAVLDRPTSKRVEPIGVEDCDLLTIEIGFESDRLITVGDRCNPLNWSKFCGGK